MHVSVALALEDYKTLLTPVPTEDLVLDDRHQ